MDSALLITAAAFDVHSSRQQAKAIEINAKNQQQISNYNAELFKQKAIEEEKQALEKARHERSRSRRIRKRNIALTGKAGIQLEGSPLMTLQRNAMLEELDQLIILREGKLASLELQSRGKIERLKGQLIKEGAKGEASAVKAAGISRGLILLSEAASKIQNTPKKPG